jgi:hypothetical protein
MSDDYSAKRRNALGLACSAIWPRKAWLRTDNHRLSKKVNMNRQRIADMKIQGNRQQCQH